MNVEIHRIYPIGLQDDGDTLCIELWERGYINWFKWYGIFDYDEDGCILDNRPTIPEQPLVDFEWDVDASEQKRGQSNPAATFTAA